MSTSCHICYLSGPCAGAQCALSATPSLDPKPIEKSKILFTRLIGLGSQSSYQKKTTLHVNGYVTDRWVSDVS